MRWSERTLWCAGIGALVYCGIYMAQAAYHQAQGEREFSRRLSAHAKAGPLTIGAQNISEGSLIGRIGIERLNLSAVVFEGTSEPTLAKGVGHLTGSALPKGPGNVVLAAHRDTFFRPLKDVKVGDMIAFQTDKGIFRYTVEETKVVGPDAVEVLQPAPKPTMTLITCYPFSYFGSAPERFVVRAALVEH
jgi:sortase A